MAVIIIEGELSKEIGLKKSELRRWAMKFATKSASRVGEKFRNVVIILQHDEQSDEVHRGIMGVIGATDVITQRYEPMPGEAGGVYGELYVNCDQALRAAPKRVGWSPKKELLLYIAHGMDHLSGADDSSEREYRRMRRRELRWLNESEEHS